MAEAGDLEDDSCSICFESNQFRVLQCGHAFCLECLKVMYRNYGGKVCCPMDRMEDGREPSSLPTPRQFEGHLFNFPAEDRRYTNIDQLIDAQIKHRMQTIQQLRNVATTLESQEFDCAIAKITGSAAGITGSVMTIVGLGLSLTGVLAPVGVPLAIAGAGVGIAGGATTGITVAVESVLKKLGIQEVQEDLRKDYFKAEQIKVLLSRAALNPQLAKKWQIDVAEAVSAGNLIPKIAKLGLTTAAGIRVALGVGRAATTAGLHIAGLIFAAAVIPLDLAQLVISSMKVHRKEPSELIKDLRSTADTLERELKVYLIDRGHFQLIHTIDDHWVYIVVHAENLVKVKQQCKYGMVFADMERYGAIIESGEGDLPDDIKKKMQTEWYLYYDTFLAETLQESLNLQDE